ncbi:hypothetical protein J0676_00735 [Vibrio sp. Vb2880]|uniref:NifB/NifX family molybdenum-iron cluster-binding protein n=1 Tax=Vibrio TaxID=662 RepID=UPI001A8D2E6F|nr:MULTISPECIES: NifB/NifX family molybdenum-iron cluster-binding protein [Vibrio]MBO0212013.1 hypothetical protein [Vibrio sp. Vb2880]
MLYALPVQNQRLSNHFSKAPQFLLFESETGTKQLIETTLDRDERHTSCGKKNALLTLLQQHHVQAVVVRNIGESMLRHLFASEMAVFSSPALNDLDQFTERSLTPVTSMSYARPSINKAKSTCGGHSGCGHQESCCHKPAPVTKLKPSTLEKLQRVLKIHR